jgi:ribokinase
VTTTPRAQPGAPNSPRDEPIEVCVVGSMGRDLLFPVGALPRAGQTVLSADLSTSLGGKGSNQAAAAARLGRRTALVTRVGADDGADLVERLARAGVVTDFCRPTAGVPSQHAVLLVAPDGENMIAVSQGASAHLSPQDVADHRDLIRAARVLLLQQEVPAQTVAAAVLGAAAGAGGGPRSAERGPLVILNPAPSRPVDAGVLAAVDYLVPNAGELADLLGADEPATAEQAAALLRAAGLPSRAVVVTLGAQGALAAFRPEQSRASDAPRFVHVPAPEVESVDTVGAGDTFCGALADALCRGEPLPDAVRWATHAGALAVTRPGAQGGLPDAQAVRDLIKASGIEWTAVGESSIPVRPESTVRRGRN